MTKKTNKILKLFYWFIDFGVSDELPYLETRKYKLINLIVSAVSLFLIIFFFINIAQEKYFLAISDIVMFIFICIPSWILQYKHKHIANLVLITSAFFIWTTVLTLLDYDVNRQTEHILPAISIMAIFLFDGWKKNLLFIFFPISFFTIRFVIMYQTTGEIHFEALHLIYFVEFLSIYTITSFFKSDMTSFYQKLKIGNETKTKLIRIISHDLRNPFSSLLGTSDIQKRFIKAGDMEKIKLSSEIINSSAKKIYSLTQSLLDWSTTQTDSLEAKLQTINLTETCNQIVEFCKITALPKEISLIFDQEEDVFCNCDEIMTQICLRNIIMNAIKFSDRNSKIIISLHKSKDNVEIHIQDFGVGLSKENLDNIFDTVTIHSSYGTENEKGTGLGIQICQELMQKQEGKITANSELGKGSTFKLIYNT